MDDIRPAVRDDGSRSMSYAEIAAVRGISADSAERLVRRRRWPKQLGNDGTVRVLVPADEAQPAIARHPGRRQAGRPPADILSAVRDALREVIQPLAEQVEAANRRADIERERAEAERIRADRAEQQVEKLRSELTTARVEAAEVRGRVTAVLADQRPAPPVPPTSAAPRRWWRPWRRS